MNRSVFILLAALTAFSCTRSTLPKSIAIICDKNIPQLEFAVEKISMACEEKGIELRATGQEAGAELKISFVHDAGQGFEAYETSVSGNEITISGGDANALMYAGLDIADMIRLEKDLFRLQPISEKPYIKHRGLRHNIPLDIRTPSYDDSGDAAQKNIATVWEWDYWKAYLDMMAENRYNLLTLWNQHPYPSWVKVPEYPDVALDDVYGYGPELYPEIHREWRGIDIQDPANHKLIKKISIDEKIAFWQKVFQYAEDRGIDIYIFHWNVHVNGAEGKHGIEQKQDSEVTVDYLRKSVKQMLLTYPNIKGIGVTAGEHIDRNLTGKYKTENWMWLTYGRGIMDAREVKPELDVRFIFRRHWSNADAIKEAFKDYDRPFETSFKYSRAHMYSSVKPPWFDRIYRADVEKYNLQCWLNVRNDDVFVFRWGDPEYGSRYVKNMPRDVSPGFYMGPDGYVWGREFISRNPRTPRQWDFDKHWYRFKIWGRASYNPDIGNAFWKDQISLRFPGVDAGLMYETWKASSDIYALSDQIHFRQNDFEWAPEGCMDAKGFQSINDFISIMAMPEQEVASIADFARNDGKVGGATPFEIADRLDAAALVLISGSGKIKAGENDELAETLADLQALGYLGRYYAMKIKGATHTAMYKWSGNEEDKTLAVGFLEKAVGEWEAYAKIASASYEPQLLARTHYMDWNALLEGVKKDVELARHARVGESIDFSESNRLWEGDKTRF